MIWRLRLGHWRFTVTIAQVTDIVGVNSLLPDGQHILMWDFDEVKQLDVAMELYRVQLTYGLPNIYILNTGTKDHFIAYCFIAVSWRKCKEIVAYTQYVDEQFFKYGVYRDHFTLRVTPKEARKIKMVQILKSPIPEKLTVKQLMSWTQYETLADGTPLGKHEVTLAT